MFKLLKSKIDVSTEPANNATVNVVIIHTNVKTYIIFPKTVNN